MTQYFTKIAALKNLVVAFDKAFMCLDHVIQYTYIIFNPYSAQ